MVERQREQRSRRRSWRSVYRGGNSKDKEKDQPPSNLTSPQEGVELVSYADRSLSSSVASLPSSTSPQQPPHAPSGTNSISENSSPASSRPTTPLFSRWSSSNVLTKQQADSNGLERTASRADSIKAEVAASSSRSSGSFGRMSFSSMMGGLSSLSLTRISTDDGRGRSKAKGETGQRARSSSNASRAGQDVSTSLRSRSTSPFHFRRSRARGRSPSVSALAQSDAESDTESTRGRRSLSYISDDESQGDGDSDNGSDSEEEVPDNDQFDPLTESNTEKNALVTAEVTEPDPLEISDPLGEGVNVVVPPEPYFPTTLNHSSTRNNPRRRKSNRPDPLPLVTGRPVFQRDRCTITLTQGDPPRALMGSGRRPRRYVVASDLSDESRYAVEWGIGTVLRDGDEMLIVSVSENDSKVDPPSVNAGERATKLRSQQERQGLAYILCRQATTVLQRTRLNVTISCEAWHAKNARHMILDVVDYVEPLMLIVGSRGVSQLKGILLGSTSHYLIQKCSVPVMVARRRLKRPPRRSAHLAKHRARVSLAEAAGIERVTQRVDEEVANMRDQIERSEDRESERMRVQEEGRVGENDGEGEPDAEVEGSAHGPARSSSMMSSS